MPADPASDPSEPEDAERSELSRVVKHAGFLSALLATSMVDGFFLLGTYYWQVWINSLMDPAGLTGADAVFFHATRLALGSTPIVLVGVYVLNDLLGAIRRIWGQR